MVLCFGEDGVCNIVLSDSENEIQAMLTFNLFYIFFILLCVYVSKLLAPQHRGEV